MREKIAAHRPVTNVEFVVVPGNHDCDFENESDIRQFLLRDIPALYDSEIHPNSDRVQALVAVQKHFFVFEARLTQSKELSSAERLSWGRLFKFDNYSVLCNCFNTAWLSRKHELQAKLFFPPEAMTVGAPQASVSATIFHHPYNWLDAGNYRTLRDVVEQSSDLVFTGHEHVSGSAAVDRFSGEHLHYVDGAALQGDGGELDSAFNLLVFDFESGEQNFEQFRWNGNYYTSKTRNNWSSLIRNPARQRHLFRVNKHCLDWLTETGIAFTHKRKREIRLPDVYVYPHLRRWSVEFFLKGDRKAKSLASKDVVQHFRDTECIFVTGADDCGKTSLLKSIYSELRFDFVPLWLEGRDFAGKFSEERFETLIAKAVADQYDASSVERFTQLDRADLLLFIDDFQFCNLNRANQGKLIETARNRFGHIYITASDTYGVRELRPDDPFLNFENCEIKEFGHQLRGQLIHKWLAIGRETADEMEALDNEVKIAERIVTTLLGKNVVPPLPINILTLLQTIESQQSHNVTDGSYGALYEVLIKASLATAGGGLVETEMQATYLSVLAYAMFEREQSVLRETDLRRLNDEFGKKFDYRPEFPAILNQLAAGNALDRRDGGYAFKYRHYYYYFVAKYFDRVLRRQDAPEAAKLRAQLRDMADRVHSEELANILLFYLYLTQDWELVNYLLGNAAKIYADRPPADLKDDVAFINRIYTEPSKILIEDSDVKKHQDEHRQRIDEAEESENVNQISLDAKVKYDDNLADIHKVNIAFKTLQVLGQVLRSSVTSLEADQRLKVASACYMLGLRTLRAFLSMAESNAQELRLYFAALIRERAALIDKNMTEAELLRRTDEGLIWLTHNIAYGTIKKISYSAGHQHLRETYDRIAEQHPGNIAVGLVDLAMKLEHTNEVPTFEITRLRDQVLGNLFSYSVLRQLVADYLYLYRVNIRTLQKLGQMFEIEGATSAAYLLPDEKKG